jgi:hypothetical protein
MYRPAANLALAPVQFRKRAAYARECNGSRSREAPDQNPLSVLAQIAWSRFGTNTVPTVLLLSEGSWILARTWPYWPLVVAG